MALSNIVLGVEGVTGALEAEDGEQAWDLLQAGLRPALCCFDIRMPRLDGLGLLQRMRAHVVLRHTPVVLVSAASDRETVQTAIEGGAAGYILKPFLAPRTRATLARVLRERLAAEAEPVQSTRRRLALDGPRVLQLLDRLRQDVLGARETVAGDSAEAAGLLQRLHGGAAQLGLWRGASLLQDALDPARADAGLRGQVLDEVVRLVDQQRQAIGPAPA
jgi:two-component system chemotaxis response regulator CheY